MKRKQLAELEWKMASNFADKSYLTSWLLRKLHSIQKYSKNWPKTRQKRAFLAILLSLQLGRVNLG